MSMKNDQDNKTALLELFDFPNGELVLESLIASRHRVRGAYAELFSGYGKKAEEVLNETVKVDSYPGLIVMRDVSFYTFCEHHFLPFFGTADIAYQPGKIITGLGKLVRLVRDIHARRLQIQEIMTKDIVEDLMRVLEAKGAMVRTRAKHLCICSRGPEDDNSWTEVTYGLGSLSEQTATAIFGLKDVGSNFR